MHLLQGFSNVFDWRGQFEDFYDKEIMSLYYFDSNHKQVKLRLMTSRGKTVPS